MRRLAARPSARFAPRGITIVEVLIVVSAVGALLGVCAVSIQLLMRLNADVQARYHAAVAVERLARQIRDDAHACEAAEIAAADQKLGKPAGLRLILEPEHNVLYDFASGAVIRTESRAKKLVRHESYVLARGADARFEIQNEGSRPLVRLVMTRSPGKSQTDPPRPLEVVAVQGKDRVGPLIKQGEKPK